MIFNRNYAVIAVSLTLKSCYADLAKLAHGLEQLQQVYNISISQSPLANKKDLNLLQPRAFTGLIRNYLFAINGYGCWCYLDGGYQGLAKGPAQDDVDSKCKGLLLAYDCIEMDALDRGEPCEAQSVDYVPYNFFNSNTDLKADCEATNAGNQCKIDTCIVEGQFTLDFFPDFFNPTGLPHDEALRHPSLGGSFNTTETCNYATAPAAGSTEKVCCGDVPHRFPYKPLDGERGCCGGQTFMTDRHMCCDDEISNLGNC